MNANTHLETRATEEKIADSDCAHALRQREPILQHNPIAGGRMLQCQPGIYQMRCTDFFGHFVFPLSVDSWNVLGEVMPGSSSLVHILRGHSFSFQVFSFFSLLFAFSSLPFLIRSSIFSLSLSIFNFVMTTLLGAIPNGTLWLLLFSLDTRSI